MTELPLSPVEKSPSIHCLVIVGHIEGHTELSGGTKTLKKLFIDKKIPARERNRMPVLADDAGVVAVLGIGPDWGRKENPNWEILLEHM